MDKAPENEKHTETLGTSVISSSELKKTALTENTNEENLEVAINFDDLSDDNSIDEEDDEVYEVVENVIECSGNSKELVKNISGSDDNVNDRSRNCDTGSEPLKTWDHFGVFFLDDKTEDPMESSPILDSKSSEPNEKSCSENPDKAGPKSERLQTSNEHILKARENSSTNEKNVKIDARKTSFRSEKVEDDDSVDGQGSVSSSSTILGSSKSLAKRTGAFKPSPERLRQLQIELGPVLHSEISSEEQSPSKSPKIMIKLPFKLGDLKGVEESLKQENLRNKSRSRKDRASCCARKKKKDTKLTCSLCHKIMHATCQNLTEGQISDIVEGTRTFTCTDCLLDSIVCSRKNSAQSSYVPAQTSTWRNSEESGLKNSQLVSETGFVGCQLPLERLDLNLEQRLTWQCSDLEESYEEKSKIFKKLKPPNGFFWLSEVRPISPTRTGSEQQTTDAELSSEDPFNTSFTEKESNSVEENGEMDIQPDEKPCEPVPKRKPQTAKRRKLKSNKTEANSKTDKKQQEENIAVITEQEIILDSNVRNNSVNTSEREPSLDSVSPKRSTVKRTSISSTKTEQLSGKSDDDRSDLNKSENEETIINTKCASNSVQSAGKAKKPKREKISTAQQIVTPNNSNNQTSNRKRTIFATQNSTNVNKSVTSKIDEAPNMPLKEPAEEYRRKAFFKISAKVNDCSIIKDSNDDELQLKNFILKIEREIFRFSLRSCHGDNRSLTDRYESKLCETCNKLSDLDIVKNTFKGKIKIVNLVKKSSHELAENKKLFKNSKDLPDNGDNLFDSSSDQKISKVVKKEPTEREPTWLKGEKDNDLEPGFDSSFNSNSNSVTEFNTVAWKGKLISDQTVLDVVAYRNEEKRADSLDLPEEIKLGKLSPMSEFWRLVESLSRTALLNRQLTIFQIKAAGKTFEYTLFTQKLESLQLYGSVRSLSGKSTVYIAPITKHDTKKPLVNGFSIDVSLPKAEIALFCFVVLNSACKDFKLEQDEFKQEGHSLTASWETDSVLDAIASEIDRKKMEDFERLNFPESLPLIPFNGIPGVRRASASSETDFNMEGFPELPDDGNDFPSDVVFEPPVSLSPAPDEADFADRPEYEIEDDEDDEDDYDDGLGHQESPEDDPRILPYFSPVDESRKECEQFVPNSVSVNSAQQAVPFGNLTAFSGSGLESKSPKPLNHFEQTSFARSMPAPAMKVEVKPEVEVPFTPKVIPIDLAPDGIAPMDPRNAGKLYLRTDFEVCLIICEYLKDEFSVVEEPPPTAEPKELAFDVSKQRISPAEEWNSQVKLVSQNVKHEAVDEPDVYPKKDCPLELSPRDKIGGVNDSNPENEILENEGLHEGYGGYADERFAHDLSQHKLGPRPVIPILGPPPSSLQNRPRGNPIFLPPRCDPMRMQRPVLGSPILSPSRQFPSPVLGIRPRPPGFLPGFPHRVGVRVYRKKMISSNQPPEMLPPLVPQCGSRLRSLGIRFRVPNDCHQMPPPQPLGDVDFRSPPGASFPTTSQIIQGGGCFSGFQPPVVQNKYHETDQSYKMGCVPSDDEHSVSAKAFVSGSDGDAAHREDLDGSNEGKRSSKIFVFEPPKTMGEQFALDPKSFRESFTVKVTENTRFCDDKKREIADSMLSPVSMASLTSVSSHSLAIGELAEDDEPYEPEAFSPEVPLSVETENLDQNLDNSSHKIEERNVDMELEDETNQAAQSESNQCDPAPHSEMYQKVPQPNFNPEQNFQPESNYPPVPQRFVREANFPINPDFSNKANYPESSNYQEQTCGAETENPSGIPELMKLSPGAASSGNRRSASPGFADNYQEQPSNYQVNRPVNNFENYNYKDQNASHNYDRSNSCNDYNSNRESDFNAGNNRSDYYNKRPPNYHQSRSDSGNYNRSNNYDNNYRNNQNYNRNNYNSRNYHQNNRNYHNNQPNRQNFNQDNYRRQQSYNQHKRGDYQSSYQGNQDNQSHQNYHHPKDRSWRQLSPDSDDENRSRGTRDYKKPKERYRNDVHTYSNNDFEQDNYDVKNSNFDDLLKHSSRNKRHRSDWFEDDDDEDDYDSNSYRKGSWKKERSSREESESGSEKKRKKRERSVDSFSSSAGSWSSRANDSSSLIETSLCGSSKHFSAINEAMAIGHSKSATPKFGKPPGSRKELEMSNETFITAKTKKKKSKSEKGSKSPDKIRSPEKVLSKTGSSASGKDAFRTDCSEPKRNVGLAVMTSKDLEDGECSD